MDITKDYVSSMDQSMFVGRRLNFLKEKNNIDIPDIVKRCKDLFDEKYTYSFISQVLSGTKKGNGINLYYFAKAIGLSDEEFEDLVFEARFKELQNFSKKKISNIDLLTSGDLSKILLSKNDINLSEDAKEHLQYTIDFLKKKYPNK